MVKKKELKKKLYKRNKNKKMELVFGSCLIFAGLRKKTVEEIVEQEITEGLQHDLNYYYYNYHAFNELWIMERDEETKQKLIAGLETVGVSCVMDDIEIKQICEEDGTKQCFCRGYYSPQCADHAADLAEWRRIDLYINTLCGFSDSSSPLEFTISKNKNEV